MKKAKSTKKKKEWHAPNSPKGSGDYYGSGVRQKMGIMREDLLNNTVQSKGTKTPPKKMA